MENIDSIPKSVLNRVHPKNNVHLQISLNAKKVLLGRSEQADFNFPDTKISRRHALFEYDSPTAQWTVESQGLNGVWLNGSQIPKDTPTRLKSQDFVQLGPEDYYVYQFIIESDVEQPRTKKSRLNSVREVLKPVSERQNVSHMASQSEALKSSDVAHNCKEAQLQQECQTLEQHVITQSQEKKKMQKEYKELQESFKTREEDLLAENAKLEAKVAQSTLEQLEMMCEKVGWEAKYQRDTAELSAKLHEEKEELKRRITRLEGKLESRIRLESVLRQEIAEIELRYQERKAALEAQLAEMQAQLEERANIEYMRMVEPFVSETEDLRGMLEKSEEQKMAVESELECSICSELFINATAPNCGHSFCEWCLKEWRKIKQECPNCRLPIVFTSRMRVLDNIVEALVRHLPEDARQKRETLIRQRQAHST